MTREEMLDAISKAGANGFWVRVDADKYTVLSGENDPYRVIHRQELEIMLLKDQLRCAMSIAFGVPYEKSEELVKYADFYRMRYADGQGAAASDATRSLHTQTHP